MLRERAGLVPKQPGPGGGGSGPNAGATITQIKPDTFYGKKLQTAMREYLEMRKAQGVGPTKPREIYDAITAGGFQFDTTSPEYAMDGMRQMLRKRTNFFHKLPNGTYGLTAWYPHAKSAKASANTADASAGLGDDDETEVAEPAASENDYAEAI